MSNENDDDPVVEATGQSTELECSGWVFHRHIFNIILKQSQHDIMWHHWTFELVVVVLGPMSLSEPRFLHKVDSRLWQRDLSRMPYSKIEPNASWWQSQLLNHPGHACVQIQNYNNVAESNQTVLGSWDTFKKKKEPLNLFQRDSTFGQDRNIITVVPEEEKIGGNNRRPFTKSKMSLLVLNLGPKPASCFGGSDWPHYPIGT